MTDILTALTTQTSPAVQLWMGWMALVFLMALIFVRNHIQAQRTVLAMIGTIGGAYIIWFASENVHLFGIIHILIWGPLAVYLWISMLSKKARRHDGDPDISRYRTVKYKAFFYWVCLLFGTIVVSLIFDLRDIILVMADQK